MSNTKLKSVDVVVVGSGVVGSIMSMELAGAGLSVVCLERGKSFDLNTDFYKPNVYDELKFDRHSDIFQNLARDTITFRNNNAQTALPMREMGAFKPGEMVVARRHIGAAMRAASCRMISKCIPVSRSAMANR